MSRPRYFRARQSHCLYSRNWHLYVFPCSQQGTRTHSGVTVKHRRRDGQWRHFTLRLTIRREEATIYHAEAVTHLSAMCSRGRVPLSKKYVRFKVCA